MRKNRLIALVVAVLLLAAITLTACNTPAESTSSPPAAGNTGSNTDAAKKGRDPYVAPAIVTTLPRNEALYFAGLGWSPINGWNPMMGDASNWINDQNGGGSRTMMFETPYMFNGLDAGFYPLLADGPFSWNAEHNELTYKIKAAAYWSDGTKVTANDAAATWSTGLLTVGGNQSWLPYVSDVIAKDDTTVVVKATLNENGVPAFAKMLETYVAQNYILQKAFLDKMVADCGGVGAADLAAKIDVYSGMDASGKVFIPWTGPYTAYFNDDTRAVLIRDDGYWGKDASMWGKLPAPKYLVNTILADNAAIRAAFQTGDIDVSQAFMPNVHQLWEDDGLPVSTFYQDAPYHLSANMPTIWFNLRKNANPVLKEVALRKAIAIATDYDAINANAMTYQSPTFADVPRSLMNPTPGEQAMYDHNAVKDLQWVGNDIAGAKKLLDDAGIKDTDGDGWREFDGKKISLVASCPSGWSDWEASLEIVAAAGKNIGIEITTNFVQESEFYDNVVYDPDSTKFDIFMMWTNSISPTEPWGRIRNMLSSEFIGMANNWSGNWNHYSNARIDEIIKAIPLETDVNKQKELYTEAVKIYLTEVPSFSAMYRPDKFHTVCESVWTGFTEQGDGRNVPPFNCLSGYAIADLFNIRLVG